MELVINGCRYTDVTPDRAMTCARGCYQRAVLDGWHTWSGSSLKGKAREYGGRYARSRVSLRERLDAVFPGLRLEQLRNGKPAGNGRLTLLFPMTLALALEETSGRPSQEAS